MHRNTLLAMAMALPLWVSAQTPFPTDFPADAIELSTEALSERLLGRAFHAKPVTANHYRVEFRKGHAFINIGQFSDSGTWRVDGGQLCVEWRRLPSGCSDIRSAGGNLYMRRTANNEVVVMAPD